MDAKEERVKKWGTKERERECKRVKQFSHSSLASKLDTLTHIIRNKRKKENLNKHNTSEMRIVRDGRAVCKTKILFYIYYINNILYKYRKKWKQGEPHWTSEWKNSEDEKNVDENPNKKQENPM